MVDTTDLKSVEACPRAGSSPAFRTRVYILTQRRYLRLFFLFLRHKKERREIPAFLFRLRQLFARTFGFVYFLFLTAL